MCACVCYVHSLTDAETMQKHFLNLKTVWLHKTPSRIEESNRPGRSVGGGSIAQPEHRPATNRANLHTADAPFKFRRSWPGTAGSMALSRSIGE